MAGKSGIKIAMVGGGSYGWSPRLLSDMMHADVLDGCQVMLLDPNRKAAEEVAAAGRTMAKTLGRNFTLTPTASPAAAFRDADFVIITISTGGLEAMGHDLKVPEKYGIFHTVGDTCGPGGWSRALRNIPVFVNMARQIEKLSPRAVVLNYTNPLAILTGAMAASCSLRCVGLCHGAFESYHTIQRILGVEEKDIAASFAGINHFFWITDFKVKGKPGYAALAKALKGRSLDEALREGATDPHGYHSHLALADELYRQYGGLTYTADRHTCEFLPGYLTPTEDRLKRYNLVRSSIADRVKKRERARGVALELASGKRPPFDKSRETAVDIMAAIAGGKPLVDVVNLPNVGQVDNLPRGCVVETLGLVDALGFRAVSAGTMPPLLAGLVEPHCHVQNMTLKASLTGDLELAMQALMLDPICGHLSPSQVRQMGMDLLRATRKWLPKIRGL